MFLLEVAICSWEKLCMTWISGQKLMSSFPLLFPRRQQLCLSKVFNFLCQLFSCLVTGVFFWAFHKLCRKPKFKLESWQKTITYIRVYSQVSIKHCCFDFLTGYSLSEAHSSTLTPMHLRKAKLMFFWTRYPSSAILKMYFPDIKFNKNNTAQLVKWFSNFRWVNDIFHIFLYNVPKY